MGSESENSFRKDIRKDNRSALEALTVVLLVLLPPGADVGIMAGHGRDEERGSGAGGSSPLAYLERN
jgi:hypothetical protein